jgi:CCR4-NOT transcription complex subunit 3
MEKFKAVEKAMKTKAYSKEGLSAATKLDPKERAKADACDFLGNMVEELERQIETLEAEGESIQATMKKGKSQAAKADRMAEIDRITERHKWHQGKLELIKRALENGHLETEQVMDLEESIKYYVSDGMNDDFMEDEEMYEELNLQDEEDAYGMNLNDDRGDSQEAQSVQDEPEPERSNSIPGKAKAPAPEPAAVAARRPSTQLRSPLPALATLHSPLSNLTNGAQAAAMKPAAVPARPAGETLKYASAAAAAAANNVGIAPLPPPPGMTPPSSSHTPLAGQTTQSPSVAPSQPASAAPTPAQKHSVPVSSAQEPLVTKTTKSPTPAPAPAPVPEKIPEVPRSGRASRASTKAGRSESTAPAAPPGLPAPAAEPVQEEDESVYHLPSELQDLVQSFKVTQKRATNMPSAPSLRMLAVSHAQTPDSFDSEAPRPYKPKYRFATPSYYPQEPLPIFDDPRLYQRVDPDTLFYIFYYRQGTYQQYLAAKALKDQSWRFHKQYQTWFQRHEEPKTITEEFEQGTYRFFDYESTWLVAPCRFVCGCVHGEDTFVMKVLSRNCGAELFEPMFTRYCPKWGSLGRPVSSLDLDLSKLEKLGSMPSLRMRT